MALQFPPNPSIGETYQSGTSATYTYNGTVWTVTTPKTALAVRVISASWGDQRANVSWLSSNGQGGTLFIADDKLYAVKGNDTGHSNFGAAPGLLVSGTRAATRNIGLNRAYLVDFRDENYSYRVVSASLQQHCGLALLDNGDLYGWGLNQAGELGIGNQQPIYEPALMQTNVVAFYRDVSNSTDEGLYQRVLIKKTDGWIYGAGYNARGGLGLGSATASVVTAFSRIDGLGQNPQFVKNFGGLNGGIFAQKADNTIVACGFNLNGWIGDGTTTQRNSFVTASGWRGGDVTAKVVRAEGMNRYHNGSAWVEWAGLNVWVTGSQGERIMFAGESSFGHAGIGVTSSVNITTPVAAAFFSTASRITDIYTAGSPHTLYVLTGSTVYGWGYNNNGQLVSTFAGKNPNGGNSSPSLVLTNVTQVLGGGITTVFSSLLSRSPLFRRTDGSYYWSGVATSGMLGQGENITVNTATTPLGPQKLRLPISESLKHLGAINTDGGNVAYVAVTNDDRFYAWGKNNGTFVIDALTQLEMFDPVLITPQVLFK